MPRSHKPRKRYTAKRIVADAINDAISGAAALLPRQREDILQPVQAAFAELRAGRGTEDAWRQLADAVNVGKTLARTEGIAANHPDVFERAEQALAAVMQRVESGRGWTLYPAEISALDDVIFIHQVQLQHTSQAEMQRAIDAVKRRYLAALAGNAGPGVRVVGLMGQPQGAAA